MSKDVFTIFSEDGMHGATCIVSLEPSGDRYEYKVIHTTSGTSGAARSLPEAMERAAAAAKGHFKWASIESQLERMEKDIALMKKFIHQ